MRLGQKLTIELNGQPTKVTVVGRTFDNDGKPTALIVETVTFGRYTTPIEEDR